METSVIQLTNDSDIISLYSQRWSIIVDHIKLHAGKKCSHQVLIPNHFKHLYCSIHHEMFTHCSRQLLCSNDVKRWKCRSMQPGFYMDLQLHYIWDKAGFGQEWVCCWISIVPALRIIQWAKSAISTSSYYMYPHTYCVHKHNPVSWWVAWLVWLKNYTMLLKRDLFSILRQCWSFIVYCLLSDPLLKCSLHLKRKKLLLSSLLILFLLLYLYQYMCWRLREHHWLCVPRHNQAYL